MNWKRRGGSAIFRGKNLAALEGGGGIYLKYD